jgi:succinate dehydrogenase/fumarate reductase flavoprotein subunit
MRILTINCGSSTLKFELFDAADEDRSLARGIVDRIGGGRGSVELSGELTETVAAVNRTASGEEADPFGRDSFTDGLSEPPFYGIGVCGALFHTQGGLKVDAHARVLRPDSSPIPGLYAGGGTAVGISGGGAEGYLAGNGLLAALGLGRIAGEAARDG